MSGFIYCLYNDSFEENMYKLGYTKNLKSRLHTYNTQYITPAIIKYCKPVSDSKSAETILFTKMEKYRIYKNKEFFKCDFPIIKKAFDEVSIMLNVHKKNITHDEEFNIETKQEIKPETKQEIKPETKQEIKPNSKKKYQCDKCKKYFHQKSNYDKHMSRKIPCTPNIIIDIPVPKIPEPTNNIQCNYCKKIYARIDVLHKHQKGGHCKIKRINDNNIEAKLLEMSVKIENMQKQINDLVKDNELLKNKSK